jgi:hypothetical protein
MSINNSKQSKIVKAMNNSKGRFFGLTLTSGGQINAQFVAETPKTVVVYDRNKFTNRRVNKSALQRFALGSTMIG